MNLTEKPNVRSLVLDHTITTLFLIDNDLKPVAEMTKRDSKLTVMDFVISVLARHERKLDKNLERLKQVTRKLENHTKRS
jgi:hypothetical protein